MKNLWLLATVILVGLLAITAGVLLVANRAPEYQALAISQLRGTDSAGQMLGKQVQVDGVVVGDYRQEDQLGGFFMQQSDPDPSSGSKGIFVLCDLFEEIAIGDRLRVLGVVDQVDGSLRIKPAGDRTSVEIEKVGHADSLPPVDLPPLSQPIPWESFEGMLVRFANDMIVADTYDLGRYGQVTLSADQLPFIPTNYIDPNDQQPEGNTSQGNQNAAQIKAAEEEIQQRTITLDDGLTVQNPATVFLQPQGVDGVESLRVGTRIKDLTGIVTRVKGKYLFLPAANQSIDYAPRPPRPDLGAANLTVASFNVLNYFTTIDDGRNAARGADSAGEFDRQREKLTAALIELDADIVGLMELENNLESEQDLIASLNSQLGEQIFAGVGLPDQFKTAPGAGNPIRVGLIYRRDRVQPTTPVGMVVDEAFASARTPLVQEFRLIDGDATVTVIVNHFKSKGSQDAKGADADQQDGQSAYNAARRNQAAALVRYAESIQQSGDGKHLLIIGDLNAYAQEDPIDLLRAAGLVDLLQQPAGSEQPFSYVYRGQAGCLDHAFASPELASKVTTAAVWHINACEPRLMDYNLEFNPPELYRPDGFRSSDHDPVLIGILLP